MGGGGSASSASGRNVKVLSTVGRKEVLFLGSHAKQVTRFCMTAPGRLAESGWKVRTPSSLPWSGAVLANSRSARPVGQPSMAKWCQWLT